jgi:hypothetical protein
MRTTSIYYTIWNLILIIEKFEIKIRDNYEQIVNYYSPLCFFARIKWRGVNNENDGC